MKAIWDVSAAYAAGNSSTLWVGLPGCLSSERLFYRCQVECRGPNLRVPEPSCSGTDMERTDMSVAYNPGREADPDARDTGSHGQAWGSTPTRYSTRTDPRFPETEWGAVHTCPHASWESNGRLQGRQGSHSITAHHQPLACATL